MEKTLYNLLKNNEAIATIAEGRIYPAGTVPEIPERPFIFFTIDRFPDQNADGEVSITRHETEIHCIASTSKAALDLMAAACNAFSGSGLQYVFDSIESESWSDAADKDFKQIIYIDIYS